MRNLLCLLAGLAAVAGCQSASTEQAASAPVVSAAARSNVVVPSAAVQPAAPYLGYHRYRGAVGGQPVTVELTIGPTSYSHDSTRCEGSYAYDRHPAGQLVLRGPRPWRPGQPLRLVEADTARPRIATGTWQAAQPAGPLLKGTWLSPAGLALPFELREDYTDGQGHLVAVRYELLQEGEELPCQTGQEAGESVRAEEGTSDCTWLFLHLLGPDTLRPVLQGLQCPVPARRRRLMREAVAVPGCNRVEHDLQVLYNDHGLLALGSSYMEDYTGMGAVHPLNDASAVTYDLRTGRPLTIAALIRPGTDTTLSRLIAQHLAQDENVAYYEALRSPDTDPLLAPLPQNGLGVVPEGLKFQYGNAEVGVPSPPIAVVVPWRELQSLLRPGTPVARMLRERGLWRPARPKSR